MTDPAFEIAANGMAAERSAMDVIASNLAGGGAPGRTPGNASAEQDARDTAFVPASFSSALDDALSTGGSLEVEMPFSGGTEWTSSFGDANPTANAGDDLPALPAGGASVGDPIGQMIALIATGRAYDADVAALQAAKQMDVEASDIDKF